MSQSIFQDPSVVSITSGAGNTGNGTVAVVTLTHFTLTQVYTLTCIQTVPTPTFSVVGSIDGSIGIATQGSAFLDSEKKIELLITAGATPFAIGDTFEISVQQGTDVNQANIDSYDELPQKNFGANNDDSLKFDDTTNTYSFNADEISDSGNYFDGNAFVKAQDFVTHNADPYDYDVDSSQKEVSDETLFRKLLKISPASPTSTEATVAAANLTRADGTTIGLVTKDNTLIDFSGATIDFSTGTGTGVQSFTPTTLAPNEYVQYALVLTDSSSPQVKVISGNPDPVLASLVQPVIPAGVIKIGLVTVQDDGTGGSGNILNITSSDITQFVISNSNTKQEGEGLLQDILTLHYAATIDDTLVDNSAIDDTNTTATFVAEGYELEYDNKVITVVGNNITLGSSPNFTLQVGDIVSQNNIHTRVSAITSQTDFDVEDGSGLTSGNNATLSQVVQTVNLTDFGSATDKTRTSDFFSSNIEKVLLFYEDDVYQDTANSPDIAASVSNNGSDYTDTYRRPNDFTDQHQNISLATSSNDLYLRFFSNSTTGSGTVFLDRYRVYYHERNQFGSIVGNTHVITQINVITTIELTNNTGSQIDQYKVVRTTGGGLGEIALADKTSISTALGIGITTENISDTDAGSVAINGVISGANSVLGFSEGVELFLGTNGDITSVPPTTGEYALKIGEAIGNDILVAFERRGLL